MDRFGERVVLGFGLFMVSVFTLLAGLAQSYEQLLFFRTAGGLGSSMFSVSAGALILRVVSDSQRGRAQSSITADSSLVALPVLPSEEHL